MKKWHIIKILLLSIPLQILANTYIINPEHSKIKFNIDYMKFTEVEGVFPNFNLYFEMDDSLIISKVEGRIEVSSINTNDKKRDSHLKKSDFFDSEKYSYIDLKLNSKSEGVKLDQSKTVTLDVTIKAITRQVNFELEYLGERLDPWTKVSGHYFNLKGELNRRDFGITWNKKLEDVEGFLLGDKIRVSASVESYKSNEKPAFSRFFKEKTANAIESQPIDISTNPVKTQPVQAPVETAQESSISSEYSSFKNVVVTLVSGFVIFLSFIVLGILGQKKLSEYLEKKNFSDTSNYIISSGVIMIILIIVSIFVAPFMGHGINPLTKYFN